MRGLSNRSGILLNIISKCAMICTELHIDMLCGRFDDWTIKKKVLIQALIIINHNIYYSNILINRFYIELQCMRLVFLHVSFPTKLAALRQPELKWLDDMVWYHNAKQRNVYLLHSSALYRFKISPMTIPTHWTHICRRYMGGGRENKKIVAAAVWMSHYSLDEGYAA